MGLSHPSNIGIGVLSFIGLRVMLRDGIVFAADQRTL